MTTQQLNDYYYGYNLRLADEYCEYNNHQKQPSTLEGKIRLCQKLKEDLLERAMEKGTEEFVCTEIFNEPMTDLEKKLEQDTINY